MSRGKNYKDLIEFFQLNGISCPEAVALMAALIVDMAVTSEVEPKYFDEVLKIMKSQYAEMKLENE
jgi:prophage maintenance system killer protein